MKDIQLTTTYKDGNTTRRCATGIFRDDVNGTRFLVLHQTARKNYDLTSFWTKKTLKQAYITIGGINSPREGSKFWLMIEGKQGVDLVSIMNDAVTEDSLTSLVFYDSTTDVLNFLKSEYMNLTITTI